ncbi:DUF6508 domain-containing protein [Paenibacillus sp. Y412MC10]|uniref:DUF6508 domain-containing protein n=1 Tax=Geobacillus sp. (strain Y412MC10) TaxID=481743 RepID=UPI0011A46DE0|nr:DUF6508 domain-containing protein [Paenibacillus sp. Y412MC10]
MVGFQEQELQEWIRYFENKNTSFCTWTGGTQSEEGVITMPYPVYDAGVQRFIAAVSGSGLMMKDYLQQLEKGDALAPEAISGLEMPRDMELLRAALTYFVRQERFCGGLWEKAIREGIFLSILYKLREAERESRPGT